MIDIGALDSSDRSAWQQLFEGYNAFYGRESMPDGFYDRSWAEFQSGARMHALGAKVDGRLLGITHFLYHANTTGPDVCYLQDLFTAAESRGQGVATALIHAVADQARAAGAGRVYWSTHESNATARRLYDKVAEHHGFILYRLPL